MAYSFNVFSGTLDQVGSSAVVFEGEVETFADLPEAVGDPAVGASYLVRTSTGVWLVNRRQAGIWIRKNNTGVRATDWEYGGDYPVNSVNGQSGNVVLGASDVGAAAATHTHAAADVTSGVFDNARINFAAPSAIGSTTPSTGAFTTLNATNGTLTASAPVLDLSQTWNNAAVTFTGVNIAITESAAAAGSRFFDVKRGTDSIFSLRNLTGNSANEVLGVQGPSRGFIFGSQATTTGGGFFSLRWQFNLAGLARDAMFAWGTDVYALQYDLAIQRDAADTLAQRRAANPQAYRIYNTFTDASNYERGFLRWSSNVLQIGTEKGGTGSARALEFQTDGVTRLTVAAAGTVSTSGNFSCVDLTCSTLTVSSGSVTAAATGALRWNGRARLNSPADSIITIVNAANTDFDRLQFGGTTSSFPALKRSSTTLQVRLADDSAFAPFECAGLTLNGNLTASTRNIVTDTTTGTRIGTGTTQLLGFWNATPAAQPAAVADATDSASTQARLNDLLARLRTIGIIAT